MSPIGLPQLADAQPAIPLHNTLDRIASASQLGTTVARLQASLTSLTATVGTLQGEIATVRGQVATLHGVLTALQQAQAALLRAHEALRTDHAALRTEHGDLVAALARVTPALDPALDELGASTLADALRDLDGRLDDLEPEDDNEDDEVVRVAVVPEEYRLALGRTIDLVATPLGKGDVELEDRDVTWASENDGIAVVSTAGEVYGVHPGVVQITATIEGVTGAAQIHVVARDHGGDAASTAAPASAGDTIGAEATGQQSVASSGDAAPSTGQSAGTRRRGSNTSV